VLAAAYPNPWASGPSASFYLPSQSLADSRYLHATSRSPHSRRSPSFLPVASSLVASLSSTSILVLLRRRCPPIPCSRGFFSAQVRPPRGVFWPLEFIKLSSRTTLLSDTHPNQFAAKSCRCSGPLSFQTLVPPQMVLALGSPSGAS